MRSEEFEKRWLREEFLLLERSPEVHERITAILAGEGKESDDAAGLDRLLDLGLTRAPTPESRKSAALKIWSRLEGNAEGELAVQAEELIGRLESDPWAIVYLKRVFKVLAARHGWKSFLRSSYLED